VVVIGELKLSFNLDLVLQAIDRTAACDEVWLAVGPAGRKRLRDPRVRKRRLTPASVYAHAEVLLCRIPCSYHYPLIDNPKPEPIKSGHVAANLLLADAGRRNRFAGPPLYTCDIKGLPNALRAPLGFLVTYKETLILLYALALTLWIAWRDARPHLKPRIVTALGRPSRFKLIGELDDYLAEGVALRNIVMSDEPIDLATESAQFRDWDAAVTKLLRRLSLRERSYFRTLDRFEGQHPARQTPDPERSHLEMMWNEKLRRLREIIAREQK
jgi:hypothetical protein